MTKIYIQLYKDGAEITDVKESDARRAALLFNPAVDGFVSIGSIAARVVDGQCAFDLRLIDDGELSPILIEEKKRTILPKLKKDSKSLAPLEPEYTRRISIRERALEERVITLEKQIKEISEKVYGARLF